MTVAVSAITDRYIPYSLDAKRYHSKLQPNPINGSEDGLKAALGIASSSGRILNYKSTAFAPNKDGQANHRDELNKLDMRLPHTTRQPEISSQICYRILNAPYLENDFYTSLVAWSPVSNHIVVGLGIRVYSYANPEGEHRIELPDDYGQVTCLAISCQNTLAVGRKDGSLMLYDLTRSHLIAVHIHVEAPLCYVEWLPGSDDSLFIGDEFGNVVHLTVENNEIEVGAMIKMHSQQICCIRVSPDWSQLVVGGNDNLVTIWDIDRLSHPKLQFRLHHNAAVKAIAYCPWAPGLLATGGGTHDRRVRFWHSKTGTLLASHSVKGQVTGILWSRHHRQLAVTFGFGDHNNPVLCSIFSYPQFQPLIQVPPSTVTRLLSAVISPDGGKICCAANDGTVRLYQLWESLDGRLAIPTEGLYGSDIIQMLEGIDKQGESVR